MKSFKEKGCLVTCVRFQNCTSKDLPGGLVAGTSSSSVAGRGGKVGMGLIPGGGAGIPRAFQPKSQSLNRGNVVTNSTETLESNPHFKKKPLEK